MTESVAIAPALLAWARQHGRHDLPWQREVSPYRVWVSEIMLQQTRVTTVIPYFERFMQAFPDVVTLADAPLDAVLARWSGLGYYARARNLHRAAIIVRDEHDGELPDEPETLQSLPGIGRSTAAAILALSLGRRHAILDGNVKRVLARYHAVPGWPGETRVARRLWELAERHTPDTEVAAYTQAIMDLGATVCVRGRPHCDHCPLASGCRARLTGTVADYPGPRPHRELALKQACCALVRDREGRLLLRQRPPAGIWGGLWSLPEWPDSDDCQNWIEHHWPDATVSRLEPIEHTFTHFRLRLLPLGAVISCRHADAIGEADGHAWYTPAEALALGLPAPIRKLIEQLQPADEENEHDPHGTLRKTG